MSIESSSPGKASASESAHCKRCDCFEIRACVLKKCECTSCDCKEQFAEMEDYDDLLHWKVFRNYMGDLK